MYLCDFAYRDFLTVGSTQLHVLLSGKTSVNNFRLNRNRQVVGDFECEDERHLNSQITVKWVQSPSHAYNLEICRLKRDFHMAR